MEQVQKALERAKQERQGEVAAETTAPASEPANDSGLPQAIERPGLPQVPPIADSQPLKLHRDVKGTKYLGLIIIVLFFLIGGGWAAMAPISGAVVAPGLVAPAGSRQVVQHLEGGIIHKILVADGDVVHQGQNLVILEPVGAKAELDALTSRLRTLAAAEARLRAERANATVIQFDHPALADRGDPDVAAVIKQQLAVFETRRANDASRVNIFEQRVAQLDDQIVGAQRQLDATRRQNELIREEIVGVKELYEKGYEKKPRLLSLQRTEANLLGDEGDLLARIARLKETIGETRLQAMNVRDQRREDIDKELADVQTQRSEIEQRIKQSSDKLNRMAIEAPVDGKVIDLRYKTPGGVIRPGEVVLSIVPANDDLIIESRVSTKDIDDVHEQQHAYVIFPSYTQRTTHRIPGRVDQVSADALQDQRTGEHYYQAKIKINRDQLKDLAPEIELTPGLPAEAFITTKDRTLLEYLIQPAQNVLEHTFREH